MKRIKIKENGFNNWVQNGANQPSDFMVQCNWSCCIDRAKYLSKKTQLVIRNPRISS